MWLYETFLVSWWVPALSQLPILLCMLIVVCGGVIRWKRLSKTWNSGCPTLKAGATTATAPDEPLDTLFGSLSVRLHRPKANPEHYSTR